MRTRRGFTIPEVLVASLLALTLMALVFHLWMSAARGVGKGEESLTSIQDASLVLLYLRKDLGNLAFSGQTGNPDLRYLERKDTLTRVNELRWDPAKRQLENLYLVPEGGEQEDLSELSFQVHGEDLQNFQTVSYRYVPARKTLRRTATGEPPKDFALPRLQAFRLGLHVTSEGGLEQSLLGSQTPSTGRLLQLWFEVRFEVQGEKEGEKLRQTRVELETKIFPLHVNRLFHARWTGGP